MAPAKLVRVLRATVVRHPLAGLIELRAINRAPKVATKRIDRGVAIAIQQGTDDGEVLAAPGKHTVWLLLDAELQ